MDMEFQKYLKISYIWVFSGPMPIIKCIRIDQYESTPFFVTYGGSYNKSKLVYAMNINQRLLGIQQ